MSDITRYTAFADSVQPADYDWGKDFYVKVVLAKDCAALETELKLVKAREMETGRQLAEMDGDIHSCSVHCTRPLCVAQRENARLAAKYEADHVAWIANHDSLVATINQQQDRIADLQRQLQNRS
jgi:hypothetical protein